jgi:hypothetical protein
MVLGDHDKFRGRWSKELDEVGISSNTLSPNAQTLPQRSRRESGQGRAWQGQRPWGRREQAPLRNQEKEGREKAASGHKAGRWAGDPGRKSLPFV